MLEVQLSCARDLSSVKVLFAGAGTAGHVEPALAVATWLRENVSNINIKFLGTIDGVETTLVTDAGFELLLIEKAPFPRSVGLETFTWPRKFWRTLRETEGLLKGADVVVGFGGYVAAPAYLAAKRLDLPIIAHEANAKMGLANILAKWCGAQMLSAFGKDLESRVGIPLRKSIINLAKLSPDERQNLKREILSEMNLDPLAPTILVFGGSLGSVKFNEVISKAKNEISHMGIQIIHAVGSKNELPQAEADYYPLKYIFDMARAYAASDLVISRSGAVSVTETGVLGLYSLYVPLPIGNGEQIENAKEVVSQMGGTIIANEEFSGDWLISHIAEIMQSAIAWRDSYQKMDFPLDASEQIARQILKVYANE